MVIYAGARLAKSGRYCTDCDTHGSSNSASGFSSGWSVIQTSSPAGVRRSCGLSGGGLVRKLTVLKAGPLHLQFSLYHRSPIGDEVLLTQFSPLSIKERPRRVWTTQTLKTPDSAIAITLTLSHRISCPPNYYGDACERYCAPRDSDLGHYKCDSKDGRIVCLPGWRGSQCTEAICKAGCLHGTCESPGVCKCREGWEGDACDQCIPFPGCTHGTCKFNLSLGHHEPFTCECKPGWSGMLCTIDTQYCSNHPHTCLNGGVCHSTPTETLPGYTCQCPLGYEGYHCESPNQDCRVYRCSSHGICQTNGDCACFDGFYGPNCQFNQTHCSQHPCQGSQSLCIPLNNTTPQPANAKKIINYRCECQAGLTGRNCELKIRHCDSRPCLHDGKCVELQLGSDGYQCICLPGFRGRHCELPNSACQHLPCANGGQCVDRANRVECHCPAGWSGPTCRQNVNECKNPVCKNGAACRDHPGTYECLCAPGWTGQDCDIPTSLYNVSDANSTTARPGCISSCDDTVWQQATIIRCAVIGSTAILLTITLISSLLVFLRHRARRHKKPGLEEIHRPVLQSRTQQVYWNSTMMPERFLMYPSTEPVCQKFHPSVKERLNVEKVQHYDHATLHPTKGMSAEVAVTGPPRFPTSSLPISHIVPLCSPSVHHAIVYTCQTPPPPYEDLVHANSSMRKKHQRKA
ncbi:unnamed protein product [Mesocestoides corti]|uniref:Delta-like protein n=1 Tax=Mesocestoides corti TaxID=53468 RepID=A0A0R3U2I3_MESCO|nr:unnamed protein product [Mesocestoides corti]